MKKFILPFQTLGIGGVSKVGGKNVSLGEMNQKLSPLGISIPNGFAISADAYRFFIDEIEHDVAVTHGYDYQPCEIPSRYSG